MIEPVLSEDAFLEDVAAAGRIAAGFRLWWLGQSGFLLQWRGRHLLLDPYLSDSLTRKYASTDKPHVRMTSIVIDPRRLDFIDAVTSSHNHTDHLDAETIVPLLEANPSLQLVIPEANRAFVAHRLGIPPERPIGLDDGGRVEVAGIELHGIAAAHEEVERDELGRCRFLGYVLRFGRWTVYHSGDTVLHGELVERLSQWPIDVALLPINGRAPERRVAGNLDGAEAAWLAHRIGASLVIPCHYEMFEFNTASPSVFSAECTRLGQPHRILACGERWQSEELG